MNDYKNRHGQALSMQWVSFLLQSVSVDIKQGGKLTRSLFKNARASGGEDNYDALDVGCTYTVNFLLPLTVELGLKALILQEGKKPVRKHDLIELYHQLSEEIRATLEKEYKSVCENEDSKLSESLERHRVDFEGWRYLDNPASVHCEEIKLQYAISTILNVAND